MARNSGEEAREAEKDIERKYERERERERLRLNMRRIVSSSRAREADVAFCT